MTFLSRIVGLVLSFFTVLPAYSAVLDIKKHSDVVYALTDSQQILRFDLASGEALTPIGLAHNADHFTLIGEQLITATNREIRAIDLSDGSVSYIGSALAGILYISADSDTLLTWESDSYLRTYSPSGELLGSRGISTDFVSSEGNRSTPGILHNNRNRICNLSISSSNLPSASCKYFSNSTTHFSELGAIDEDLYLLSSGYIFDSKEENIKSRIPETGLIAATYLEDDMLVVDSEGALIQYTSADIKSGTYNHTDAIDFLTSSGSDFVAISVQGSDISGTYFSPEIDQTPIIVELPSAEEPPENMVPEQFLTMQSGNALFYDRETRSIHIWSLATNDFTDSYYAGDDVLDIAYDEYLNTYFSVHSDGYVRRIDFKADSPELETIAYLPGESNSKLVTYMDEIRVYGAGSSLHSLGHDGNFLSTFSYYSRAIDAPEWHSETTAYYYSSDNYLYKLNYDIETESSVNSEFFRFDSAIDAKTKLIPETNLLVVGNGQLFNAETLTASRALSRNTYDAAYPAGILVTVSEDRDALHVWSESGELTQIIYQAENSDLRLFYDDTYLGVITMQNNAMSVTRYNIASNGDSDGDDISDFFDSCPDTPNADQTDMDGDFIGDVCDSDIDGDEIPNDIEVANGLDPEDFSDRAEDKDNDGLPNFYEYLTGTDISIADLPTLTDSFTVDFNNGVIPAELVTSGGTWFISSEFRYEREGFNLQAPKAISNAQLPYILFYASFDGTGDLQFYQHSDNHYYSSNPVTRVYVDGVEVEQTYQNGQRYIDGSLISTGIREIKIELQLPNSTSSFQPRQLVLDDIRYKKYLGPDYDGDDIPDTTDNCRYDYNPDQSDTDQDGYGDACDNYNDLDYDDDGVLNNSDNCPYDFNPNQADTDRDGEGDSCDYYFDLDSDGDGAEDDYDNCPAIWNSDQADLDYDWVGDACDSDIDGDGISNSDEISMGRDPNVAESLWQDSDNDSVADFLEAGFDMSPSEFNDVTPMDLSPYHPLGNITSSYSTDDWDGNYTTSISRDGDRFIQAWENSTCKFFVEPQDDGIYITGGECEDGTEVVYTGYLLFPASAKPGETITKEATQEFFENGESVYFEPFERKVTFTGTGTVTFGGETYKTIELGYGPNAEFREVYAEGLGLYSFDVFKLDSIEATDLQSWGGSGGSSSSGGALNLFWLVLASLSLLSRRRSTV